MGQSEQRSDGRTDGRSNGESGDRFLLVASVGRRDAAHDGEGGGGGGTKVPTSRASGGSSNHISPHEEREGDCREIDNVLRFFPRLKITTRAVISSSWHGKGRRSERDPLYPDE